MFETDGKDTSAAKSIFRTYNGMFFHMAREGDYEKYASFGISKAQEREWRREMQAEYLEQLKCEQDEDLIWKQLRNYTDVSRGLKDVEALDWVLEYIRAHLLVFRLKTLLICCRIVVDSWHMSGDYEEEAKRIDEITALLGIRKEAEIEQGEAEEIEGMFRSLEYEKLRDMELSRTKRYLGL